LRVLVEFDALTEVSDHSESVAEKVRLWIEDIAGL
jgi:hypothetical protein